MEKLRALIVEDSEDDTELLVRELQRADYDVTYVRVDNAKDLRAALDQCPWDVIFADYTMPHFNSFAALEIVKERAKGSPFIIVSGTIGEERAIAAMKAGAQDYLIKGNLARLAPAVKRELREAEMHRNHRQVEEERARLISILEATSDFVSMADPDGRIIYINSAGRRAVGIASGKDIDGLTIAETYPEQLRAMILNEAIPAAIRDGVWKGETALLSPDKRGIPVSQVIIGHRGTDGTVQFLSTIARDISERKQAEETLQETNRRLQQQTREIMALNKLFQSHLKERFAAIEMSREVICELETLSHEINNLLKRLKSNLPTDLSEIPSFIESQGADPTISGEQT